MNTHSESVIIRALSFLAEVSAHFDFFIGYIYESCRQSISCKQRLTNSYRSASPQW